MIKLRRKKSTRTFQCDVAGCRNRTNYLISKREDVTCRPLHLCDECIRGIYGLLTDDDGPEVPSLSPDGQTAEADTLRPADPEPEPEGLTLREFLEAEADAKAEQDPEPEEEGPKPAPRKRTRKTGGTK